MEQYIPKSIVAAKIERLAKHEETWMEKQGYTGYHQGLRDAYKSVLSLLDTIETKEVDTWHLQEKEDIYDAVKGWDLHTFMCIMKDGTIQKFTGCRDEDHEGHINVHINGVNDDYDDIDDIIKWIEYT